MTRRETIEAALAAGRDAERRLEGAVDGQREGIAREVEHHRTEFQPLSAEQLSARIGTIREGDSALVGLSRLDNRAVVMAIDGTGARGG